MSQTTYNLEAERAFAGMLAEFDNTTKSSVSRANEESSAVAYGKPAVQGTNPEKQFLLPSGAGDKFIGCTVHRHGSENLDDDGVASGETAEILRRGKIWVVAATAVAVGDDVYWRHTTVPGTWRNDATDSVEVPQAKWATPTSAPDQLAVIDFNLP